MKINNLLKSKYAIITFEEAMIKFKSKQYSCPVDFTLSFIGGKWKILILYYLYLHGFLGFSAIRKNISKISEKMLTQQLKELKRDGFIERKIVSSKPLRVEYSLSKRGKSLSNLYVLLSNWGINYLKENGIDYIKEEMQS